MSLFTKQELNCTHRSLVVDKSDKNTRKLRKGECTYCMSNDTFETHIELKSFLNFCTEHNSTTVVLCVKFQTDLTIEMDIMDERDFARFDSELGWIIYSASAPMTKIMRCVW